MKTTIHASVALAAAISLTSGNAFSQTATDTMGVSMTVAAECTISTGDLAFGAVGILSSDLDAATNVTIQCTEGSAYNVALSAGAGAGATVATRLLTHSVNTAETAGYSIYQDSERSTLWGDDEGQTVVSAAATGADEVIPVYGRVFGGQNVPAGTYADTITATITYGGSL